MRRSVVIAKENRVLMVKKKKSPLSKMKPMAKAGIDSVRFEETIPKMQDGAGQLVSLAQAAKL
jgi:hypothetical protein